MSRSRVVPAGTVLGLAALIALDFVVLRPNRIAPGRGLCLFEALDAFQAAVVLGPWAVFAALWFFPSRRAARLGLLLVPAAFVATLAVAGVAGGSLLESAGRFARVSLGTGFWTALFGLFVVLTGFAETARPSAGERALLLAAFAGALAALAAGGLLAPLSLVMELAARSSRFGKELADHLFITGVSVGASVLAGVPLGIVVFKRKGLRDKVFFVLNILQTIPSLALFGLLIAPLAWLSAKSELLAGMGVSGIGWAPAVIALTLYALLPIVRNTFAGFYTVEPSLIEAGRGMGMSRLQVFNRVELPVALPVILGGVRIACVQNIGNTAVAALIGAGGFGAFIFQGLGQAAVDLVLLGAVPTIVLAVAADAGLQWLIKRITPRGLA